MSAFMIVHMNITDDGWIDDYFNAVPALLADYGGLSIAGGRHVRKLEGTVPPPQRLAVLAFPSLGHIEAFMLDERYRPFKEARERGAASEIFIFENEVTGGELR